MIRRSPSRNQRSKSIKIKHVLQIILLLGVCFWLIYQVKHSNDKKKEFDENDAKASVATQTAYQLPKLGRKGLYPYKDEVNQNEKNEEEAEDENIVEDDENMHEHNEQEEEEDEEGNGHETEEKKGSKDEVRKGEEQEEDERGGGDDEIDENDPENSEVDTLRNEESMDEEKEKEGDEENEISEDDEKEGSVENHNTHEAREEHYKGDDASSAVTHDTHTTSTETETVGLEKFDVNSENHITKSEESNRNQTGSDFKVTEVELTGETSSNVTSGKETGNNSLSNPVDSLYLNNTATAYSDSHSEVSNNLTVVIPGSHNNITETGANTSSEHDKMVIFSESNQARNGTVNTTVTGEVKNMQAEGLEQGGNRVSEENLHDSNSSVPVKTENGDAAAGESSILQDGELEKTTGFVASKGENKVNIETSETNKTRNNSNGKEEADTTEEVKLKGATQTGETDEISDSSTGNGTSDSVEHHATDSSDSHILKDVTEVRTDLDTLPDIRNEGHNGDQTATE